MEAILLSTLLALPVQMCVKLIGLVSFPGPIHINAQWIRKQLHGSKRKKNTGKGQARGFLLLEDSETELDGGHRVKKENYFLFHKILN